MLTIDLVRLDREKTVEVDAAIPPDDPLWEGTGLDLVVPLEVEATASLAGSGEIVVRGRVRGRLRQECRRCLAEVTTAVDEELTLVFTPRDELAGSGEDDPELRVIEPSAAEIELGEAIREELILEIDPYVVCDTACKGLCPRCGVNLNEEECDCTLEEPDPRWDALRSLKED